jgi:Plavaka transposase
LPDEFKDFAQKYAGGKGPNDAFMAHCHRQLFHEQWKIILDDEFMEAYQHGIVVVCCDGITRRFYPRIFTYSADYPEKYVYLP